MMRLDRLLVDRGFGSRKQVTKIIRQRRVTKDGEVLSDPKTKVAEDATLEVDGEESVPWPVLIAYHKPVGVLSSYGDNWGRETLSDVLGAKWLDAGFHPVGRLDKETSGLLLFSRVGRVTQHLLHPRRALPRTYQATSEVDLPEGLVSHLESGVQTSQGTFQGRVEGVEGRCVTLTVQEGKHRMVRRMMANAGAPLGDLHRIAYGTVQLGELAAGAIRVVTEEELSVLGITPQMLSPR